MHRNHLSPHSRTSDLKLTRIYDAPVQLVWEVWTDSEHVAKWWGPRGFTLTTHSKDLRPGGHWHYTMHGPDGTDYENKTLYYEVEECAKLVYDHGGNDERKPLFRVTVHFRDIGGGKTELEVISTLPTPEAAEEMRRFIKMAGGTTTWDRLAEYLAKQRSGQEMFIMTRAFAAPRDHIYRLWQEAESVRKVLPSVIAEAEPAETHPPLSVTYQGTCLDPVSILQTTIEFAEEDPETTRMTVTSTFSGSPEVLSPAREQLTREWTKTMDALEDSAATD